MPVDRFSLTMDPDLGAAVRESAERAGTTVSAWLSQAAADRVLSERMGAALSRWAEDDGPLSEQELDEAREALGLGRLPRRSGA